MIKVKSLTKIPRWLFIGILLCLPPTTQLYAQERSNFSKVGMESPLPTIAIIIDDMGNYRKEGWQIINLPYPLTLSFLPKRPFTVEQAKTSHFMGKEIMMHAPMTNILGMKLGYGALTGQMSEHEIKQTLQNSLLAVPYVQGVNNHMGSQLTQKRRQMSWVMQELTQYPVYFVDSRTISSSVAGKIASEYDIPTLGRDVFLDNWQTFKAINFQFKRLIKIARRHGTAIAIGHPHQATADYLTYALPKLDEQGIAIATVSAVWEMRNKNREMYNNGIQSAKKYSKAAKKPIEVAKDSSQEIKTPSLIN